MAIPSLWQQPAPVESVYPEPWIEVSPEEAAEISRKTLEALGPDGPGFIYWKCQGLDWDMIKVTNNPRRQPGAMAEYTLAELEALPDRLSTIRLIHRAKLIAGAQITSSHKKEG